MHPSTFDTAAPDHLPAPKGKEGPKGSKELLDVSYQQHWEALNGMRKIHLPPGSKTPPEYISDFSPKGIMCFS